MRMRGIIKDSLSRETIYQKFLYERNAEQKFQLGLLSKTVG